MQPSLSTQTDHDHTLPVPVAKQDSKAKLLLGSCGMYVFRMDTLQRLLASAPSHNPDFGRDLIPLAVNAGLNVSLSVVFPLLFLACTSSFVFQEKKVRETAA